MIIIGTVGLNQIHFIEGKSTQTREPEEREGGRRRYETLRYGAFALTINRDTPRSSGRRFNDNHSIGYF
jgi:hypothetical protein